MIRSSGILALVVAVALGAAETDARAGLITYVASLNGASESPPNASLATGFALVDINVGEHTMRVFVGFSDLEGETTAAHIHSPTDTPGEGTVSPATQVPSFAGFPLGQRSGTYLHTFDLLDDSTYNPSFLAANGGTAAGAESALLAQLAAGKAYLNVHSTVYPGGEIRGFLQAVPEPTSLGLMALGGLGVALFARRRRGR